MLRYVLDENEFLSPYGIRSLSRVHARAARTCFDVDGEDIPRATTCPASRNTGLFGGNSNWRGPVWFPVNYLLIEALERYHHFYGDELQVECPTGSGRMLTLAEVAREIWHRGWARLFLPDARRPPARATARTSGSRPIRTGGIWSCSTSTSTATTAAASAPATRPAGPRS